MKLDIETRVSKILEHLEKEHPDAKIALHYTNPLELLVATILSAQCTDKRVNIVTKTLQKIQKSRRLRQRRPKKTRRRHKAHGLLQKQSQKPQEMLPNPS